MNYLMVGFRGKQGGVRFLGLGFGLLLLSQPARALTLEKLGIYLGQDVSLGSLGANEANIPDRGMLAHSLHGIIGIHWDTPVPKVLGVSGAFAEHRTEIQQGRLPPGSNLQDANNSGTYYGLGTLFLNNRWQVFAALGFLGSIETFIGGEQFPSIPKEGVKFLQYSLSRSLRASVGYEIIPTVFLHTSVHRSEYDEQTVVTASPPFVPTELTSPIVETTIGIGISVLY